MLKKYFATTAILIASLSAALVYGAVAQPDRADLGVAPNYIPNGGAERVTVGASVYKNSVVAATPDTAMGGTPTHITVTRSTSNPLAGNASWVITNSGTTSAQGEGFKIPFTINRSDQGKTLTIALDYLVNSGTFQAGSDTQDSDLELYVKDETNVGIIQPVGFKLVCSSTTLPCRYIGNFQAASNSLSYDLLGHVATTNTAAWALKLDSITVSPVVRVTGAPVTDWVAYTPTFTGLGTVSGVTVQSRRVGDSLEVEGIFTAGTVTGSTMNITYGYSGTNGNVSLDTTKMPVGVLCGFAGDSFSSSSFFGLGVIATASGFGIGQQATAASILSTATGSAAIPTGAVVSFHAKVPVLGWSSGLSLSADAGDSRDVSFEAYATGTVAITANQPIILGNTAVDNTGGYNAGTGQFKLPSSGNYVVGIAGFTVTSSSMSVQVYKNGTVLPYGNLAYPFTATSTEAGQIIVPGVAGDLIDVRGSSSLTLGYSAGAGGYGPTFYVYKKQGNQTLAASDTVAARYADISGLAITSATVIAFGTKDYDRMGSYSGGTFTCKGGTGLYQVSTHFETQANMGGGITVWIYKNGSSHSAIGNGTDASGANIQFWGSGTVQCNDGETLDVREVGNSGTLVTTAGKNWVEFHRFGN